MTNDREKRKRMGCVQSASFSSVKYVSRNKFVCYARQLHLHSHSIIPGRGMPFHSGYRIVGVSSGFFEFRVWRSSNMVDGFA